MGLITYLLLPPILFTGLLLIPLGAWRKKRLVAKGLAVQQPQPLVVDFSKSTHRNAFFVFLGGTSLVIIASVIGSYESYQYTESVQFCGQLCHQVMKPEFTTHQVSPHARVKCADCHIGEGADWFVKSKLSGLHQVYAVLAGSFPRPIPTPVKNLRPAAETCEQCHWPEHFFSAKERVFPHFLGDEKNTPWSVRMRMNIGGGSSPGLGPAGIHGHMVVHNKIWYAPRTQNRQEIAWVKVVSEDGKETVYTSKDNPPDAKLLAGENLRKMDCMDCHNRPSHHFLSPARAVDQALASGRLDASLPFLKVQAVKALAETYSSDKEADEGIAAKLKEFYADSDVSKVEKTVKETQALYRTIQFPFMKANWKVYPDNIGHMEFPGCFRCHGSDLATPEGKGITRDCNACHQIMSQGSGPQPETISSNGLEFKHPGDVDVDMKDADCNACHTGGPDIYP